MQILDDYLSLQKQVYEYFGYVEDWRVFPIDDRREYYWRVDSNNVEYGDAPDFSNPDHHYEDTIYTYRHLSKHVYRGNEFTMVIVDTITDGNKFLAIYDNSKEVEHD